MSNKIKALTPNLQDPNLDETLEADDQLELPLGDDLVEEDLEDLDTYETEVFRVENQNGEVKEFTVGPWVPVTNHDDFTKLGVNLAVFLWQQGKQIPLDLAVDLMSDGIDVDWLERKTIEQRTTFH